MYFCTKYWIKKILSYYIIMSQINILIIDRNWDILFRNLDKIFELLITFYILFKYLDHHVSIA